MPMSYKKSYCLKRFLNARIKKVRSVADKNVSKDFNRQFLKYKSVLRKGKAEEKLF